MSKDRDSRRPPPKRSAPDSSVYRHPDAPAAPPKTRDAGRATRDSAPPAPVVEREPIWARKPAPRLDKRERAALRSRTEQTYPKQEPSERGPAASPPRGPWPAHAHESTPAASLDSDVGAAETFDHAAQRRREVRIFGRAACLAVARDRIDAIRKIYYSKERARELAPLLEKLAKARVGFREVAEEDLNRLASSQHHEGIVCDLLRREQPSFDELVAALDNEPGPACLLALEGVGNPHNFGAILRSAVHFGVRAVLIPADSALTLAGAVYRVAEGGAERVPVVRYESLEALREREFTIVAAATAGECELYRDAVPPRSLLLFGAEGPGLSPTALALADQRLAIPGSGRVDSLNVAQAVAVVLGEWWRAAKA